jgi:hypothetical protein
MDWLFGAILLAFAIAAGATVLAIWLAAFIYMAISEIRDDE